MNFIKNGNNHNGQLADRNGFKSVNEFFATLTGVQVRGINRFHGVFQEEEEPAEEDNQFTSPTPADSHEAINSAASLQSASHRHRSQTSLQQQRVPTPTFNSEQVASYVRTKTNTGGRLNL
jgi:hypothetical protein